VAAPNTVLNAIVAEAFNEACDALEGAEDFESALHAYVKDLFATHQRIVFNGNGYSDEWVAEAERRGLPNITSMVDAIPALCDEKSVALFTKLKIFTAAELESRVEIKYEGYSKSINIESQTAQWVASKSLIPAIIGYAGELGKDMAALAAVGVDVSFQKDMVTEMLECAKEAKVALDKLKAVTDEALAMPEGRDQAVAYRDNVIPAMEALRAPIDQAEMLVGRKYWPMPSYAELLFEV
ncbi:MAG: glutamine synthetase type III, partial [Lachnospiraceae bacterium]|nr:glutamine synthetase type III [Candidatus Equihabitans merdae]